MSWTDRSVLRTQLQRTWDRGKLLAETVTGESSFPRRLTLKTPTSAQMADDFDAVRAWIAELRALPHYRIEMREWRHRVLGVNQVPSAVWVDTLDDALAILGKRREFERFSTLVGHTRTRRPELLDWMSCKPHKALALADEWDHLLDVTDWVAAHPRPGIYLRQVDIPGVHSKFIEAHRSVLIEWLDRVLPPEVIDTSARGVSGFTQRYGFHDKPLRIRLRGLDPARSLLEGLADADITLDAGSFIRLQPAVSRVFITENEINFLAFPAVADSLLVFGAGYGFDVLAQADWLAHCQVYYWGDVDTHGFAILDQLRAHIPHARSLLMDRATLLAFEDQWGTEETQTQRDLSRLDADECALYDDLRDNRIGSNLRLEQERIAFRWVEDALSVIFHR
ncbi:MAG: DUF3322 and DUF2220 domain-containing protein [Gammaproteobacteria bacterium]|nr:MAG: DUF3322 and DUF2220 domain-containing protein [Gammaproteobacteria bacterium]